MDNPKNNNENEINCPDIHGSAIYDPTNEGIQKYSPACKKHMKPFKFKFDKSFSHTLVLGPTGSGKGVTVSIAQKGKSQVRNSLTWEGSKIIFDMQKEEFAINSSPSDFTIKDVLDI